MNRCPFLSRCRICVQDKTHRTNSKEKPVPPHSYKVNPRTLQVAGIHSIKGDEVTLTNNVILHPKMLVCATGWNLDLDCLPSDRANQSFDTVQSRLFCRFWDIDYPGLVFVSLSNGFMCATENANLVSQAVAQALLGQWRQPSMQDMLENIENEVKTGIFVPGKAMTDLQRAGFKGLKAGWDYL